MGDAVRIGGQALADGVLMRTTRAWAVARDDGSVQIGTVPTGRLRRVPVLRFVIGLASGMRLAVAKGMLGRGAGLGAGRARRRNRAFLMTLVAVQAVGIGFSLLVADAARSLPATLAVTAVPWGLALGALRLATPASLWRYHGAEHKAVTAHEAGIAMDDVAAVLACSRVHDRCGTNLVFVAMVGALALVATPAAVQLPALVVLLAAGAEGVSLAASRPRSPLSRTFLAGGRALQRFVTTSEPTAAEQAVGCRALAACLEHHHRLAGTAPARLASGREVLTAA